MRICPEKVMLLSTAAAVITDKLSGSLSFYCRLYAVYGAIKKTKLN